MRNLFEAFISKQFKHFSLKNKTTLNLKQSWIFIPLDYNLFSSKWLYFIAFLLIVLSLELRFCYTSSDIEQACPIIQLLDSDHELDSETE